MAAVHRNESELHQEQQAEEHGTAAAEAELQCRICHTGGSGLFSPCLCKGSHQWVHESCLQEWRVKSSRADSYHTCELCQYQYTVARAWWATALDHPRAQLLLTQVCMHVGALSGWTTSVCAEREQASERDCWERVLCRMHMTCARAAQVLVVLCISIGRVVWNGWTRFFVAVCHEPEDSFRFVIKASNVFIFMCLDCKLYIYI
jgi:hypothetical protein